jgi:hypothetical protein
MSSLEEPSSIATECLKIKTTCTRCNTTTTLYLQNVCKIERGGLLVKRGLVGNLVRVPLQD